MSGAQTPRLRQAGHFEAGHAFLQGINQVVGELTLTRGTPGLPMKLPNFCMDSGEALLQVMAWTRILTRTSLDSHSGRTVARTAAICTCGW